MRGVTLATSVVAAGAATVLSVGVVASVAHGAIPRSYTHDVHVDGRVDVKVDVTVHTPDLGDLKPGQLVPDRITVVLPDGFTLRLPDSNQTVDVHTPTDYTVHQSTP
jgi:hypothetical protein